MLPKAKACHFCGVQRPRKGCGGERPRRHADVSAGLVFHHGYSGGCYRGCPCKRLRRRPTKKKEAK
jgi:hypothetical protein